MLKQHGPRGRRISASKRHTRKQEAEKVSIASCTIALHTSDNCSPCLGCLSLRAGFENRSSTPCTDLPQVDPCTPPESLYSRQSWACKCLRSTDAPSPSDNPPACCLLGRPVFNSLKTQPRAQHQHTCHSAPKYSSDSSIVPAARLVPAESLVTNGIDQCGSALSS